MLVIKMTRFYNSFQENRVVFLDTLFVLCLKFLCLKHISKEDIIIRARFRQRTIGWQQSRGKLGVRITVWYWQRVRGVGQVQF